MRVHGWAIAAVLVWTSPACAAEVQVAVAANFAAPMQRIAAAFEQHTGHRALLAIGSTGRFYAQIRNGAPFDVLLAADDETPARLEREGHGVAGSRFTYAVGRLVLWSRDPKRVDDQGKVLEAARFQRLALADARLSPYGAAAMQVLGALGLVDRLRPSFVQGENIAQAHQFVATGNAELGFVALSQLMSNGKIGAGSAWIVPAQLHAPIRQDALLLDHARHKPEAALLLQFLRSDQARAIVRGFGYEG